MAPWVQDWARSLALGLVLRPTQPPGPPTHMSGECTVCTCPAYSSLSSMGMSTRKPSLSSSLSMMQERGAAGRGSTAGLERGTSGHPQTSLPPAPPFAQARPSEKRCLGEPGAMCVLVHAPRWASGRDMHAGSSVHTRGAMSGKTSGIQELGDSLHTLPLPHPKDHHPRRLGTRLWVISVHCWPLSHTSGTCHPRKLFVLVETNPHKLPIKRP